VVKNLVAETTRRQAPACGPHVTFPAAHSPAGKAKEANESARTDPASLAQQLRTLQQRSESVLAHELIGHPAAGTLRELGQALLVRIQQIQELRQSAARESGSSNEWTAAIENLVAVSHGLLDTIVAQIRLCDTTARQASIVTEWGRRLVAQEKLAYQDLLPLFSRVLDEVGPESTLSRWIPLPGLPLASLVEARAGMADAAIFVEGVTAARVLVWALYNQVRESKRLPQLVLAALLGDVGRLLAASNASAGQRFRAKRTEWLDRHHPSIGAAILGTIRRAPVGLALLVGQHHERLDGGGFPRGLMPRDLFPDAATLAAAIRFAGICLAPVSGQEGEGGRQDAARNAARVLLSEAEWGLWPVDFARHISHRIALAETEAMETRSPAPRTAERGEGTTSAPLSGDRHWYVHDEEEGLQGTHRELGRLTTAGFTGQARS
jgi:hypothetical protein